MNIDEGKWYLSHNAEDENVTASIEHALGYDGISLGEFISPKD